MYSPYQSAINTVNIAGAYPTAGGGSIGIQGSTGSDFSAMGAPMEMMQSSGGGAAMEGSGPVAQAVQVGAMGSPAAWWLSIAVCLFVLMFIAKRFGSEGADFSNIKLSVYNTVVIALAAVIGMTLLKALFTKIPVPGLSTLILAA